MRFTEASIIGFIALLSGISANLPFAHAGRQLRAPESNECVIQTKIKLLIHPENARDGDDIDFVCELHPSDANNIFEQNISGLYLPIDLDDDQKQTMIDKLDNGELRSNVSTLIFEDSGIMIGHDKIYVPPGQEIILGKSDSVAPTSGPEGDRPVLVVRVTDTKGKVVPEPTAEVGDDVFGTLGDPVNVKSQYYACTWGKLNLIPGSNKGKSNVPGVVDVTIPLALEDEHWTVTIENAITTAVNALLDVTLPGPYKQVMYVLEGCYGDDCGWAGYAYVNMWMSVYNGGYYKHVGVQMHELGHNFDFGHSGYGNNEYGDHTCLMGNPLYSDDRGKMCFNGAKNWQIGWYNDRKESYTPTNPDNVWSKRMVGVANYGDDPDKHPIILKIEWDSEPGLDFYVAFNRATGINEENVLADDEVTIVMAGNEGVYYNKSRLIKTLKQGETHNFRNWKGSGKDLTITAEVINIQAPIGYADVKVCYGSCDPPPPTASPSFVPTNPEYCEDSKAWYFRNGNRRRCKFVKKRMHMCDFDIIQRFCPGTCRVCEKYECEDADLPFYRNRVGLKKWTCAKVADLDPEILKKKCSDAKFYTTCRSTCNACGGEQTVINFDEKTGTSGSYYRSDLKLDNWGYIKGSSKAGTGYDWGTISEPNVGLNNYGRDVTMSCPDGVFTLHSMHMTPAWTDDLLVTLEGYAKGSKKATFSTELPSTIDPIKFEKELDQFTLIDFLKISTDIEYKGQVAIDDMIVEIISPCNMNDSLGEETESADGADPATDPFM